MITILSNAGFCSGVRNAINHAEILHSNIADGIPVFLLGDLVNNTHVMNEFMNKQFRVTEDPEIIPRGAIAVIRAHGVPRAVINRLHDRGVIIEDCTCIRVKNVHKIVEEKSAAGYKIIVVGKAAHPEVIGTIGWCVHDDAYVAESESDTDNLDLSGKLCVVAQTTCSRESWTKITNRILEINGSAEIFDTLCKVTAQREEAAEKLAEKSDIMLVIGDEKSSNSRELFRRCGSVCTNTYFIGSSDDITESDLLPMLGNDTAIGLAAGASTPDNVIREIYDRLLEYFPGWMS